VVPAESVKEVTIIMIIMISMVRSLRVMPRRYRVKERFVRQAVDKLMNDGYIDRICDR